MTPYALAILLIVVLLAILFKVPKKIFSTKITWEKGMWIGIMLIIIIGFIPFIILDLLKWPGELGMILGIPFYIPNFITLYIFKSRHVTVYHVWLLIISIIVYGILGALIGYILSKIKLT